ncbi:hypothetical protein QBC40DRAFT_293773 [Triangularia verruculosa]|uniref:Uncharacterized protein n=1 Tax=Triangularia verruculosa TaxID=2587418 RepID=A0AAN6XRQ7_9PEZI|nr:hypothetical protein QBC40DRAFT_293773 [Triangularia verruculosa]
MGNQQSYGLILVGVFSVLDIMAAFWALSRRRSVKARDDKSQLPLHRHKDPPRRSASAMHHAKHRTSVTPPSQVASSPMDDSQYGHSTEPTRPLPAHVRRSLGSGFGAEQIQSWVRSLPETAKPSHTEDR